MAAAFDRKVSSATRNAPYSRRGKNFLKLLNVIRPLEPVFYRSKREGRAAEGRITNNGIVCNCCGQIFTLTGFETHAGCKKYPPSSNIYLDDVRWLSDCLSELKSNRTGKRRW